MNLCQYMHLPYINIDTYILIPLPTVCCISGGAVPVLVESLDKPTALPTVTVTRRSRSWSHLCFCGFCGRVKRKIEKTKTAQKKKQTVAKKVAHLAEAEKDSSPSNPCEMTRCAHCPRVFHPQCLQEKVRIGLSNSHNHTLLTLIPFVDKLQ